MAIRAVADGLSRSQNRSVEEVMQDSPIPLSNLTKGKYLHWDLFAEWMAWLDQTHQPVNWKIVGKLSIDSPAISILKNLTRMTLSVKFGYWFSGKWFGPSQFRAISTDFQDLGNNQITIKLKLQDSLKPCPQLFQLIEGSLEIMPKAAFGLQESVVRSTYEDYQSCYQVQMPAQQTFCLKLKYFSQIFFNFRSLLKELVFQQELLQQQALKILSERSEFKNLIDRFPDGIVIHRDGVIQYANPRGANYLGVNDNQELVGTPIVEFIDPKDREAVYERIRNLQTNPKHINPPIEASLIRKDNREVIRLESTSVLTIFEGLPAVAVIFRDLSDRKKIQAQMVLQDRMMALGQLAAGIGHEINNPLFYVMMKVESLMGQLESKAHPQEQIQLIEIQQGLEKIQSIVKELKTFSRGNFDETPTKVDIQSILTSAIGMAKNHIQHRAQLKIEIEESLPFVDANEARLSQVFLNLLINAAQAIEPGHADHNEIQVKAYTNSHRQVVVEVRDTGRGILPEHRKNLFQPFYTTKPVGEGTGLGLSICHSIITQYRGTIAFESQVGKGTLFQVVLPASKSQPTKEKPISARLRTTAISGKVLIIDDDEELLSMLEGIVAEEHQVFAYSDARKALARVTRDRDFDCIVCDLMMPNMDGPEFFEELQVLAPGLCQRIVFMTGGSFTEKTDQFLNRPHIRFREKPINSNQLLDLIGDVVDETRKLKKQSTMPSPQETEPKA